MDITKFAIKLKIVRLVWWEIPIQIYVLTFVQLRMDYLLTPLSITFVFNCVLSITQLSTSQTQLIGGARTHVLILQLRLFLFLVIMILAPVRKNV